MYGFALFLLLIPFFCYLIFFAGIFSKDNRFEDSLLVNVTAVNSSMLLKVFIMLVLLIVFLANNVAFKEITGIKHKTIENIGNGTYSYYVSIYPSGLGYEDDDAIDMPAQIVAKYEQVDENNFEYCYYLQRAYFNDGTYIAFDDYPVDLHEFNEVYDNMDDLWYCKLTDHHANSQYIEETPLVKPKDMILLVVVALPFLYNIIGGIIIWNKRKKEK